MLRPRIIPCLLVHDGGLVKTVQFSEPKYLGDPLNAVRIFNEKLVDELMVIDIDCTRLNQPPNEKLIAHLAAECRMPLCYGGGIKTVDQIERLISLGVEKVAISSAALENPGLVSLAAERVGRQSIVGVIDVKRIVKSDRLEVVTHNGRKFSGIDPVTHAEHLQELGVGEIVVNSVDRDGLMVGYDLALAEKIWSRINVPLTILGGAGSLKDIELLFDKFQIIGAAAGSVFVFKGKHKAFLINYPTTAERDALTKNWA